MSVSNRTRSGAFTLIELLVVIAIIALLAAILFPAFARARENARRSTCVSNLKQFNLGIMQYSQDYDEMMPLCVKTADGAGSDMIGQAPITQEFGVPVMIAPYIKSKQVFQCPDDSGFLDYSGGANTALSAGVKVPLSYTGWQAYGTSYKFNFDSFSLSPHDVTYAYPKKYTSVADKGTAPKWDKSVFPVTMGCGTTNCAASTTDRKNDPPYPMSVSYFARPSETMVMHCYLNNWSNATAGKDGFKRMHDSATPYAFADGHVKALLSKAQSESFCDGPTYSPIRNASQPGYNKNGDGSCNTAGVERNNN